MNGDQTSTEVRSLRHGALDGLRDIVQLEVQEDG